MLREISGVGASVTVLKDDTVAPRKCDSGGECSPGGISGCGG